MGILAVAAITAFLSDSSRQAAVGSKFEMRESACGMAFNSVHLDGDERLGYMGKVWPIDVFIFGHGINHGDDFIFLQPFNIFVREVNGLSSNGEIRSYCGGFRIVGDGYSKMLRSYGVALREHFYSAKHDTCDSGGCARIEPRKREHPSKRSVSGSGGVESGRIDRGHPSPVVCDSAFGGFSSDVSGESRPSGSSQSQREQNCASKIDPVLSLSSVRHSNLLSQIQRVLIGTIGFVAPSLVIGLWGLGRFYSGIWYRNWKRGVIGLCTFTAGVGTAALALAWLVGLLGGRLS
jgi:hypothetical protein